MLMPKFDESVINLRVELNRVIRPMPSRPRMVATSLLRTKLHNMPNTCALPKRPVYFRTCE